MNELNVLVKDKETGNTYKISEARYRRTPELWDRIGTEPAKPKTSVAEKVAAKKAEAASDERNN